MLRLWSLGSRSIAPRFALATSLVALAACSRGPDAPLDEPVTSFYALVETLDGVALYPPLGPDPAPRTAPLDTSLLAGLSVVLESSDAAGSVSTVATFTQSTTPPIRLFESFDVYFVNVPAAPYFTDATRAYRFRVLSGAIEIARSDLSSRIFEVLARNPGLLVGVKVRVEQRPAPVLASIAPETAIPGSPDLALTVRGSAFLHDSVVRLDGEALATTWISGTELVATVPASRLASPGSPNVTVETHAPGGGTSGARTFTIINPRPTLAAVSPAEVTAGAADLSIDVSGSGFVAGASVVFDDVALATTFRSDSALSAAIPARLLALAGAHAITVLNPEPAVGASAAVTFTTLNPAPSIAALSPSSVVAGSAAFTLTVTGSSFVAGTEVLVDGAAVPTTFVSASELDASIAASTIASAGTRAITARSPAPGGGTSAAATLTVSNPSPSVTSLSPAAATAGAATFTLTVNGASFVAGSEVSFAGSTLATTFVSATSLTAIVPSALVAAAGTYGVVVTSPAPGGGTSGVLSFVASNAAPVLASFTPASVVRGTGATTLTVIGASFVPGASIVFAGTSLATTWVSASELRATLSSSALATAGLFDLAVVNPAPSEGASATRTFTVNNPQPAITSLSPASATVGAASLSLTIDGSSFVAGAQATFNGATVATTFVSSTRVIATVPAASLASAGSFLVTVANTAPNLGASAAATFTVNNPTPVLASVTPASALRGAAATTITLDGSSFVSGAVASIAGTAMTTTFVSSTRLTAVVSTGSLAIAGTYGVTVANPAPVVAGSGSVNFTVNNVAPTLTTLAPATASAGAAAFTLTVNGSGFVNGAQISFGATALTTTFVSATQVTGAVPASAVTTGGTITVTVTNPAPNAGPSAGLTFTVNSLAPTISALTPSSIAAGSAAFTLTVDGASFQPSSSVTFGGSTLATTYVSATRLTASVLAASVATYGTANVTVTTPSPGGGTSAASTFTITARLTDGLIAQYDFEETSGQVIDRSGNGNNLTLNGATRLAAGFGASPTSRGLACSGGQTATAVSSVSLRSPRDQLTIAGWIKPTVTTGDPGVVAMGARGGSSQAWGFYIRSGAELGIFTNFPSRSSSVYDSTTSGANIRANEWAHVAVVIDYPSRTARYYKNGALIYTGTHNVQLDQLTVPLTFCSEAGAIQDYSGQLDDFSIWNRALSADEIATVARQLTGSSATVLGSGTTCSSILTSGGSRGDGLYALDPDGLGGVPPMITYCDMTSDGGGWTLVGNQIGSSLISSVTSDDINPQNDGSLTSTFRFGNARIQAFTPSVAWKMRALNSSNVVTDLGYLRPQCVVNWLRMVGIRTSDCNNISGITIPTALDTNCGILYTSPTFATLVSNYTPQNCALGIGQNNSGANCSMRFSSVGWGTVPVGAALPCDVNRTTAVTMQLWLK